MTLNCVAPIKSINKIVLALYSVLDICSFVGILPAYVSLLVAALANSLSLAGVFYKKKTPKGLI